MARILVTGAAGFIGSHLSERLLDHGHHVVGLDNFCDFYARSRKEKNLQKLRGNDKFKLIEADIRDAQAVNKAFDEHRPDAVIHIAAMAGVRPSIERPKYYTEVNLDGTVNILDTAARTGIRKFLFASSSSVYGNNPKAPFAEDDPVERPISPYAATKRAGELICHAYHHLHKMQMACLRFFTVYGPRQRPDLAIGRFLELVAAGKPIELFGDGSTSRDYTYIDDIIDGVMASLDRIDKHGYRIWNLGGSHPATLAELVACIEKVVGKKAKIECKPPQPGDVERTWADLTRSRAELGYQPRTSLEEGIRRQWEWMREQE